MFRVKETTVLETDGSSKQNQGSLSLQGKCSEVFFSFSPPYSEIPPGKRPGKADHIPDDIARPFSPSRSDLSLKALMLVSKNKVRP